MNHILRPTLQEMADAGKICMQILWLLILWFIGWPVAGFCAGFYILFLPFTVCIEGLKVHSIMYEFLLSKNIRNNKI